MTVRSLSFFFALGSALAAPSVQAQQALRYSVGLADSAHHVFRVALQVPALAAENDLFEFASTAPGTYQTMDIGRFVRDFTALDDEDRRGLPVRFELDPNATPQQLRLRDAWMGKKARVA